MTSKHYSGEGRASIEVLRSQSLTPLRMSRCVLERLEGGERAVVRAIQRRALHLAVVGGPLLLLCRPDVPLAPNAFAVDVEPDAALEDQGFRVGHVVSFRGSAPSGHDADWRIALETAVPWEPRPARTPDRHREDRTPSPVGLGDHVPAFLRKTTRSAN